MKNIKKLFIITIFCCMISSIGASAFEEVPSDRSTMDNYLNFNLSTPPYNGYTSSPWRKKYDQVPYQEITNVKNTPSYDDLDVRLKYDRSGNTMGELVGSWYVLSTGKKIVFQEYASIQLGYYQMYVDSRVHYTGHTKTTGYWYLS